MNGSETYTQLSGNKLFDLTVVLIFPTLFVIVEAFKKWVPVEQERSGKSKKRNGKDWGKKKKITNKEVPKSVVKIAK